MPPPPRNTNYDSQSQQRAQQPDRRERAKSPVLDAIAGAARALSPVSYLLKPRVGMMNDQFPEDREQEEDEGPSYRSFGAAMSSPVKRAAELSHPHQDASFLSATTANGSEDASRSYGGPSAESSYQFDEEERLMEEIEQERQRDKGKGKAVASGSGTSGGWLGGLPGLGRASPAPSNGSAAASSKKKATSKDASYQPRAISVDSSSGSDSDDSDEFDVDQGDDKVTKSTSRRKPRISHDNAAFKYRPGQSGSEESESDGDGGRRKRRRRKSGKIGPLGAEGMTPVVEGKKRKGKKGKRSTKINGFDMSEDDEEPDVSMDIPALPQDEPAQGDESYDDDPTMDFGNDDSRGQEEDDSFVVQVSKAAARGPAASDRSQLPTHFKSKSNSPLVVVRDAALSAVRYALVGLILTWNGFVAGLSWVAQGLRQSLAMLDWSLASKAIAAAVVLGTLAILLDQPTAPAHGVTHPPTESTSWLPSVHFNRPKQHGSSSYRTPDLPPESMDELIERLAQLESALGSLTAQAKQSDAQRSQVETHVVQLQDRLSSDIKKVSSEADKRDQAERERLQSLDKVVGKIRGDVDVLNGRVKKMGEQVESDAKEIERLDDGAEVVRKELKSLSERVREAEKVAKEAADASRVAKIATDAIESYLPSKLVVRMNPKTNTLDIDPSSTLR